MAGKAGKAGVVTLAGNIKLKVTNWNSTDTTDSVDTTGMSDGGYKTSEAGLKQLTFTITAFYSTVGGATGLPSLSSGDKVVAKLETDAAPLETIDIPSAQIDSVGREVPVEGGLSYTIEGHSDGAYTVS